jgi:predicted nucleic acid-binding Zn ribbon protein
VLTGYLHKAGLAERVAQAGILGEWPALVGARMAAVTEALEMRADGTLVVRVRSAPWAQELSLMTPQIIARLNAGRPTGRVERIRWVVSR